MTRTNSVRLGSHFANFVEKQAASGRYASTDDVVEAALRLLERDEMKLELLRRAIEEGEASGPGMPFDLKEFLDEMHAEAKAAE